MRTVVVCCDPDWQNWASLVRTRALDLYHTDQQIEFWDSANNPGPDASLWGNWPRYFSSGGPAVIADLDEQTTRLAHGESLAVLFVYGSPSALETAIDVEERRGGPPSAANLRMLRERIEQLARHQGNPVMRIGLFRCDATAAVASKAAALVACKLFDAVFFLGMHAPSASAAAQYRPRQFDAVRLVADIARDVDAQGAERDKWRLLRYQPTEDQVVVYWLHPPPAPRLRNPAAPPGLGNPSAMIASAMVAYFDQQTRERGLDQSGETLKDFKELEDTIAARTSDADTLGSLRATDLATPEQQATAADELFGDVEDEAQWRPPLPPTEPHLATARQWQKELDTHLSFYLGGRRKRIRDRQKKDDACHRRLEAAAARVQTLIHAVSTGLTGNAYGRVEEILGRLRQQRARFIAIAEAARAAIAAIAEEERGGGTDIIATSDRNTIEWFRRFEALRDCGDKFVAFTADCLNLGWMSRAAEAVIAVLYLLLAVHTRAVTAEASIIRVLLLGFWPPTPELTKPAVFCVTGLLLVWTRRSVQRQVRLEWEAKRNDTRACADVIASIIRRIDFYTVRHADATAVISWLARIERRLSTVAANIADNVLHATINQLRDAGAGMTMGESEQRAFENALGAQLQRAPIERWLRVILLAAPSQPQHRIPFQSPGFWTGEVTISSQLQPDPGLRVRIESLTLPRPRAEHAGARDMPWRP
jgi:hypothetical protein